MLYRDLHHAANHTNRILAPLDQALLADSMQEMTDRAGEAHVAAEQMLLQLQTALRDCADSPELDTSGGRTERHFAQVTKNALQQAIAQAQRIRGVTETPALRARLLDFKRQVDFADAYLRAAIGQEQTSGSKAG